MKSRVPRYLIALIAVGALLLPHTVESAQAQEGQLPVMRLGEIEKGMRGVGRTVIEGQRVEEFEFEIIGILRNDGSVINVKNFILFRMFGPVAERSGGVAAGMSGSPMYINGKLIGALSAGYTFQSTKLRETGLATPIEEMLPLLREETTSTLPRSSGKAQSRSRSAAAMYLPTAPLTVDGRAISRVVVTRSSRRAREFAQHRDTLVYSPSDTITRVRGLSPHAFSLLKGVLGESYPRPVVQAGGGTARFAAEPIRSGSSVGVLLSIGDVEFGGICTVTLRRASRVLVCGHPWDQLGRVSYALAASEILTVVKTLERPFKDGNFGGLIGQIDLDRGQAIRGVLGRFPRLFALRVSVVDTETTKRVTRSVQLVRRPDLAKVFAPLIALTAVERARDQQGGDGTAHVKITLRAAGLPRLLVRENRFYSSKDVGTAAMLDLPTAMQFLFSNPFVDLDPIDASVEVTINRKRETATITDVAVESREVSPGERLRARVTVRPFQDAVITSRTIDIIVPRNFPRGPAVLLVGSGGVDPTGNSVDNILMGQLAVEEPHFPGDSLEEAIEIFENLGLNNQLFLQLVPFGLPATPREFTQFDVFAGNVVPTNWVIQGQFQVPILVR